VFGTVIGWSSIVGTKIKEPNEYFKIESTEFDWIASIINLGGAISVIIVGSLMVC
jgi:hypothetical protein